MQLTAILLGRPRRRDRQRAAGAPVNLPAPHAEFAIREELRKLLHLTSPYEFPERTLRRHLRRRLPSPLKAPRSSGDTRQRSRTVSEAPGWHLPRSRSNRCEAVKAIQKLWKGLPTSASSHQNSTRLPKFSRQNLSISSAGVLEVPITPEPRLMRVRGPGRRPTRLSRNRLALRAPPRPTCSGVASRCLPHP